MVPPPALKVPLFVKCRFKLMVPVAFNVPLMVRVLKVVETPVFVMVVLPAIVKLEVPVVEAVVVSVPVTFKTPFVSVYEVVAPTVSLFVTERLVKFLAPVPVILAAAPVKIIVPELFSVPFPARLIPIVILLEVL